MLDLNIQISCKKINWKNHDFAKGSTMRILVTVLVLAATTTTALGPAGARLSHATLQVADLDATRSFWEDLGGMFVWVTSQQNRQN